MAAISILVPPRSMPIRCKGMGFPYRRGTALLNRALPWRVPGRQDRDMTDSVLDVKGLKCPLPVLRANRALRDMAPGERLRVLATDPAAVADFQAFCQETGHA